MRSIRAVLARIAGLFAGPRSDDDLREELQAHLEMEAAEYVRRGMPPEEARRRAALASGGITQAAEAVRVPELQDLIARSMALQSKVRRLDSTIHAPPTERTAIGNPLVPQLNRLKAAFEQ